MFIVLGTNPVKNAVGLQQIFRTEQHMHLLMGGVGAENLTGKRLAALLVSSTFDRVHLQKGARLRHRTVLGVGERRAKHCKQECVFHEHPHHKKACSQALTIVTKEQCRSPDLPAMGTSLTLRAPHSISLPLGVLYFFFQLLYALHDLMKGVREWVADVARISNDHALAVAEDDMTWHAHDSGIVG